ncbi:hypothetical protein BSG1_00840 [Bacillus sp. SG-1]|nr:hypothetical protein BSG1_00840 [Bacillus sp. SG-1]
MYIKIEYIYFINFLLAQIKPAELAITGTAGLL